MTDSTVYKALLFEVTEGINNGGKHKAEFRNILPFPWRLYLASSLSLGLVRSLYSWPNYPY